MFSAILGAIGIILLGMTAAAAFYLILCRIMWDKGGKRSFADTMKSFSFMWIPYEETLGPESSKYRYFVSLPYWYVLYKHRWFDWVYAGCRFFWTKEEAIAHWQGQKLGFEKYGEHEQLLQISSDYRRACKFVEILERDLSNKAQ